MFPSVHTTTHPEWRDYHATYTRDDEFTQTVANIGITVARLKQVGTLLMRANTSVHVLSVLNLLHEPYLTVYE